MSEARQTIIELSKLRVEFVTTRGTISAVDDLSLSVRAGQTVALVGESGCGKSVTALSIMRLIPQPPGQITADHMLLHDPKNSTPDESNATRPSSETIDILKLSPRDVLKMRGRRIAMIFQDPHLSLNPVRPVGRQIVEVIKLHQPLGSSAAGTLAIDLLRDVGISDPQRCFKEYPHRLSGGMKQRVMIAMALSCRPSLLIADEPTTALDVTIQLQVLSLLRTLQRKTDMGILLITHDFGVVAAAADYVYVMYAGRIVEHGSTKDILDSPLHPYTQGLISCTPRITQESKELAMIPGSAPDPSHLPSGCRFHPRCQLSADRAQVVTRVAYEGTSQIEAMSHHQAPPLRRCVECYDQEPSGNPTLTELHPGRFVACWEAE